MGAAGFFYVLFLFFFLAIGAISFGAWFTRARVRRRAARTRAAKARARAAMAKRTGSGDADARPFGIEVVQTDDSARAHNSSVVMQPGNLRKRVTTPSGVQARTDRSKCYWDFWEQFLNRVSVEHPGWMKTKRKTPTRTPRCNLPSGTSAVAYSTAFTPHGLSVQLYFSSPDARVNSGRFEALHAIKGEFERALGQTAEWDDKPGRKAAAICVTSQFADVANQDSWPAMLDWVLDQHVLFRHAVDAVGGVGRLKETTMPCMPSAKAG